MPGAGCHVSPGDLGFSGVGFSCQHPLLHLLLSVPPAACHCMSRAMLGALASSCPTECGTGGVGLKCSPEGRREGMVPSAPVWVGGQDGLLPFGLAAPNFRSPLHPPGIRMMSPGEQWPLHGSSWGQKLGPESVPLGETWSDTPGRTKGLAAPQGSASVK